MSNRVELFDLMGTVARRRFQAAEQAFAPLGVNHTEARLLVILDRETGRATQELLSDSLTIDRSNAGRALKRLEERGHITRRKDETDNRTNLVELTSSGSEAVAEVNRLRHEVARSFFSGLTEADAGRIVELLGKAVS